MMPNSPSLYETVQANYLQQRQKDAVNTIGGWTATAGAATAAGRPLDHDKTKAQSSE